MTGRHSIRIVATNDFFGSYQPWRTSYGSLPGGEGLRRTIARLREGQPTLWADVGDFSGGPLAVVSDGVRGFDAAAELGIDVAAAGNHEFDWGVAHLRTQATKLGFPLLCGNADVGLPATALISTNAGAVGFVGLTMPGADLAPQFGSMPSATRRAVSGPSANADISTAVREAAYKLRQDGADFVVVLLHDGVDVDELSSRHPVVKPDRLLALCRPWVTNVNAIVAGHTVVARWFGDLDGVPIVQPWAYGAEVAVLTLRRDEPVCVASEMVVPAGPWRGRGSGVLTELDERIIGTLPTPLTWPSDTAPSLLDFMASALRASAGTDVAAVMAFTGGLTATQPVIGGVQAALPAGVVSEADLLRAVPWPDDATVRLQITRAELDAIIAALPFPGRCILEFAAPLSSRQRLTVAMTAYMATKVEQWLGVKLECDDTGVGLRDALRAALREASDHG